MFWKFSASFPFFFKIHLTVVYRSFTRLLHLVVTRDIVKMTILAKVRTCLLEVEGNIGCDALLTDVEHPGIITDTGFRA